jgi:hypothetical protein
MASFDAAIRYARMADELGYDPINCGHIASRDSLTVLAGADDGVHRRAA